MKAASNRVDVKTLKIGGKTVKVSLPAGEPGDRKRQKLLYVRDHARRSRCSCEACDEATLLVRHGGFEVVSIERDSIDGFGLNSALEDVLVVWTALVREFTPVCLGFLGEARFGARAASRILSEIWDGAPMPGAIVLRAPGPDLIKGCFSASADKSGRASFADASCARAIAAAPTNLYDSHHIQIEFPPTLVMADAEDALLGETARAYRTLRRSGIPIGMEVFEGWSSVACAEKRCGSRAVEQASEIARFFDRHLDEGFPRMFLGGRSADRIDRRADAAITS
jgi:acetyl esterase/lipase